MVPTNPDEAASRNATDSKQKYWRMSFWVWAGAIYISLIYSTGLCQSYGFERTLTHAYFLSEGEGNYGPGSNYRKYYSDVGILSGTNFSELRTQELWKLATFSGDAGYYLLQSVSLGLSVPPYKFRFLPTTVVGLIAGLLDTQALIPLIFVLVNVTAIFSTAIFLTYYLIKDFGFASHVALVGGVLFVTLVSCTTTVSQPMVEPMSLLFSMLVCLAVIRQNVILFIGASVLGVATKEILLFASLLWFANYYPGKGTSLRELLKTFCISVVPIVAFVVIRFMLGGRPDQVSYGFNLFDLEFPAYYLMLSGKYTAALTVLKIFTAFGFLWFGLYNMGRHPFLQRSAVVVAVVLLAAIFLSEQKARPLGILFPIIIPSFLYFLSGSAPTGAFTRVP